MTHQTYSDGYIKSDIKLSIGMLVSNHIQYIEKCLEGLKPLLDSVPAELIVLDTVGPDKTDGSIEICRKFTDKIYRFEWINDFSAARNALLERSSGEWFMYQDDDEWFDDVSEFVGFFSGEDYHRYNSGFYYTRDYDNEGGFSVGLAGRMIRRKPDSHFVGKIHEGFSEINNPGKQFSMFTHHMGYVYESEEDRSRKSERNISLLKEELDQNGPTPSRCAQMVQEYMALKKRDMIDEGYILAQKYADELIRLGLVGDNCTQWIITAQARYFLMIKDGEGLVKKVKEIREKYGLSRYSMLVLAEIEADGIVHYHPNMKECLSIVADDVGVYSEIDDYFATHPDDQLIEAQLDFPRFYTQERKNAMYTSGAQAENFLGNFDKAYAYWKKTTWEELEEPVRYKDALLATLQNLKDPEPLKRYYQTFMNQALFEHAMEKYYPKDLRDKLLSM